VPGNGRLRRGEYTEKFRRHSFPIAEQLPGHAGAGATGQLSFIVGVWPARPASPPRSTDDSTSPAIAITSVRSCRGSSRPLIRCTTPGRGAADRDRLPGQASLGHCGESAVLLVPDVHGVHRAVAPQRVDHRFSASPTMP
jgi:hypothetical protein